MDSSIILSGRPLDLMGSIGNGLQTAGLHNELARGNALAAFGRQHGAGLARGDMNALAAYAALNPEGAIDVQGALQGQAATRQGMELDQGRYGMEEQRQDWLGENYERDWAAEDEEADRADTLRRVQGIEQALGSQNYDLAQQMWAEEGLPQVSGPEEMAARLAQMGSTLTVMQGAQPPAPVYREFGDNLYEEGADGLSLVMEGTPDPADREMREDPNGVPRYVDDASEVFPGITEIPDPATAVGPNGLDAKQQLDAENGFVDDWTSLPAVKDYEGISRAYSNITAAAQEESGAGDIALITMLGKLLDPTSVVREAEFAIASNAGGTLAWLESQQDRVLNGQLLTPDTRAQIVGIATEIQREAEHRFGSTRGQWEGMAEHRGLDPEFVMPGARYSQSYTGAPPFAPVAQPRPRPGGLNLPPPTGQPGVRPSTVGQGDTGQPTGSGASRQPAQGQPTPIAIPTPQDAARMAPQDIAALVREAAAQGITIPGPVRRIMLQRLNQTQGGR